MRLLLDSHALIWYVDADHLVSRAAYDAISDRSIELLLSAATIWEISIKVGLQKLTLSKPYSDWMDKAVSDLGLNILPIKVGHANALLALENIHRDPFDRLMAAQSLVESVSIVSNDRVFDRYGVKRLW
jgi:PIN domain nuclease of toxin-antitoxin system